jgi:hypothetical protein
VLASGTHVRGFEPGRRRRIFQGEKILSRQYHVADLRHVKDPYNGVEVAIVGKRAGHFSPTVPLFAARGLSRRCGRGGAWRCKWERPKVSVVR